MSLLETVNVICPYCGEQNQLVIDKSISHQEYIEDCAICCRPITLLIAVDDVGDIAVVARSESE